MKLEIIQSSSSSADFKHKLNSFMKTNKVKKITFETLEIKNNYHYVAFILYRKKFLTFIKDILS